MDASLRTGRKSVATKETAAHTTMPTAEMIQREDERVPARAHQIVRLRGDDERSAQVASREGAEEVGTHPGDVADVIADVRRAMVRARLRGSSSGMPATTLPARVRGEEVAALV